MNLVAEVKNAFLEKSEIDLANEEKAKIIEQKTKNIGSVIYNSVYLLHENGVNTNINELGEFTNSDTQPDIFSIKIKGIDIHIYSSNIEKEIRMNPGVNLTEFIDSIILTELRIGLGLPY